MSAFPQPGDTYGKYRIDRLLGRGGMGAVYAATDTLLGRQVALKVVLPSLSDIDDYKARFAREAALLARVRSQHIVQIHEYGEQDEALYLVTELFPDGDLFQWLRTNGPLDPATALGIVARCAEALHDAHSVGVVHRDIKPSNILLWNRDGALIPYLCDFGIASDAEAGVTATGLVVGSFAYMAPERHLGENADYRADIYSLGCLLWAMLTGNAPFEGTDFQVMNAHIHSPVPEFPGEDPLTGEVNEVLQRTMAKNPDDRYPSAAELRRYIAAHLDWTGGSRGPQMVTAPPVAPPPGRRAATPPQAPAPAPAAQEPAARAEEAPADRTVARPAVTPAPTSDPAAAPHEPPPPRESTVISARRARPAEEPAAVPDLDEMARTLDRRPDTAPPPSDAAPVDAAAPTDGATSLVSRTVRRSPDPEPEAAEPAVEGPPEPTETPDPIEAPLVETMLHRPVPATPPVQPPARDPEPVLPAPPAAADADSRPRRSRRGLAIAAIALVVVGGGAGLAVALGSGGGAAKDDGKDDGGGDLPTSSVSFDGPVDMAAAFSISRPETGQVEVQVTRPSRQAWTVVSGTTYRARTAAGGQEVCVQVRVKQDDRTGSPSQETCGRSKAAALALLPNAPCNSDDPKSPSGNRCYRVTIVASGMKPGSRPVIALGATCTPTGGSGCQRRPFSSTVDSSGRVQQRAAFYIFKGQAIKVSVYGGPKPLSGWVRP